MNSIPDESFIPLAPKGLAANERPDSRVKLMAEAAGAQPLPVFRQKNSGPAVAAPADLHVPQVVLQRDGDRVSAIRIQCACGRVVELTCDYGAPPPSGA